MSRYLLFHLLLSFTTRVTGLADCYLPNGTALPLSRAYQPCISTENVFSMCCVLNTTALEALGESAANLDTCLENGMCQPPAAVGGFARDLCTDPTWKSPNCLNVCVGGTDGGSSNDTSFLTQCTDGTFCCGEQNTTCCNDSQGFQVAKAIGLYATASSSTSTASASLSTGTGTGSGTSFPETSPSSSSTPPAKSTSTNGAVIGLGAALGVFLIAIIVMGVFLFYKRRSNKGVVAELGAAAKPYPGMPMQHENGYPGQYKAYQPPLPEVPVQQSPNEITPQAAYAPGEMYPAELDTKGNN